MYIRRSSINQNIVGGWMHLESTVLLGSESQKLNNTGGVTVLVVYKLRMLVKTPS
jgi:hypothetical protein